MAAGALHSVPPPPEPDRDIDKTVAKRKERANERLNSANDPIAKIRALADNLTSAMRLLNPTEQGKVLAQVAPTLLSATTTAYQTALRRKRRRGGGGT